MDTGNDWFGRLLGRLFFYRRKDCIENETQALRTDSMAQDLAQLAKERGIRYFMISYTDLFGGQRHFLVVHPQSVEFARRQELALRDAESTDGEKIRIGADHRHFARQFTRRHGCRDDDG